MVYNDVKTRLTPETNVTANISSHVGQAPGISQAITKTTQKESVIKYKERIVMYWWNDRIFAMSSRHAKITMGSIIAAALSDATSPHFSYRMDAGQESAQPSNND